MKTQSTRMRLLASSMICGAAALAFGGQAFAQDTQVEELVVTGSRIPQPNLSSTSPITVIGDTEAKLQGTTNVESLINNLPQAYAGQTNAVVNGATGTATVNLRGLGAKETLVLIDGRRMMPGDVAAPVADLNQIPAALVDRVEVLTGGASAVYGSDAVAGVVNFIMKRDFEGVRIDAQYGFSQHTNDNDGQIAEAIRLKQASIAAFNAANPTNPRDASNWVLPDKDWTGGATYEITAVVGVNSADGKGNATAYAGYRNIQPVLQSNFDWAACGVGPAFWPGSTASQFGCAGSSNSYFGNFTPLDGNGLHTGGYTTSVNGDALRYSSASAYNFSPTNYIARPDERYVMGAFAHYEVTPWADVYTDLMFADDHTVAQIAASGLFRGSGPNAGTWTVNCDNPFLGSEANPNSMRNALCGGLADSDSSRILFGRRAVEAGNRQDDLRHTSYRIVLGTKGQINDAWSYDLYGQFGRTIYQERYLNDVSSLRVQRALNVVQTANGPVCKSVLDGSDPSCIPLNIFATGAASQAAWDYVQADGFKEGETTQQILSANITGDLGQYGMKFPWATDGLGIALGAEYRQEHLVLAPDEEYQTGDLTGQGGPTPPVDGAYNVREIFGEMRIPIIQDHPFFNLLQVELGYRHSDYSNAGGTDTYKIAADWAPTDDIRFRGSFQHAVRAPNIVELFTPSAVGLFGGGDPCAAFNIVANPVGSQAYNGCIATGATPDQLATGSISPCPAAQCTALFAGNPNLSPEDSDTLSFGVVFTPTFFRGFSLAVDYYNIKIDGLIGAAAPAITAASCGGQADPSFGNAAYCGLFHRDAGGNIFGNAGYIIAPTTNTGGLQTKGLDIEANYRTSFADMGMGDWGSLAFNLVGTYTDSYKIDNSDGALDTPEYECAGLYGLYCAVTPLPKWRHKLRVTWNTPWNVSLSVNWRYIGGTKADFLQESGLDPYFKFLNTYYACPSAGGNCRVYDTVDTKIGSQSYFDLAGTWQVKDGVTIRAGVNNVMDEAPPLIDSSSWGLTANNTFAGFYDTLGRSFFVGITADF